MNSYPNTPPVREGELIDVKIEAIGEKGDGIARKDGYVLIIPNTQIGDEVRVKVTRTLPKVGFAEVTGDAPAPEKSAPAEKPVESSLPPEDSEDFGEDL